MRHIVKVGLFISIVALIHTGCAQRHRGLLPRLELGFQNRNMTLTQGVNEVVCRLENVSPNDYLMRGWFTNEFDEPPNFVVFVRGQTGADFIPCYDTSMLYNDPTGHEFLLKEGDAVELRGQVVFNLPIGDYEMFARLREQPDVITEMVRFRIAKGTFYEFPKK